MIVDSYYRSSAWTPTFAELLRQLKDELQPMSETVQTPRWLPDADSGTHWFVRPLETMATWTASSVGTRYATSDVDSLDAGLTGQSAYVVHPLPINRDTNPIVNPTGVSYPSLNWTGTPTTMACTVRPYDGDTYYIQAEGGPVVWASGWVTPQWAATVDLYWNYADLTVLDGTTYATAWPGIDRIDWSQIGPGDTLWVCGTHEGGTMTVGASGTAGNYIKIRFDYPTDPGRMNKAQPIETAWVASGSEWYTQLAEGDDISECVVYEDEQRLIGCGTRARCRIQAFHSNINYTNNSFQFVNIRRIQTGDVIEIPGDFVWESNLPLEYDPATKYYAIVDNCTGWVGGVPGTWQYYSVSTWQYTVRLAATYADAMAGTAIDITALRPDPSSTFFIVFIRQATAPFYDPMPGSLNAGEYAVDIENRRLHYRPTTGVPGDHEVRMDASTYAAAGTCIYGRGVSYIRILGGGEYGGLFGVAPVGRIGLTHQNCIEFSGCSNIVIDGLRIDGCRSAVAFVNTPFGTARNCRIQNAAHHGCGGEELASTTQEPDMLLERNWFSDIGTLHEFSDAQSLVTNPDCHRTIFRRNYTYNLGQNTKVSTCVGVVFDSSEDVYAYLNWFDFCHGAAISIDAGNGESGTHDAVAAINISTRQGQELDPSGNLVQRVGFLHQTMNGPTDPGVVGSVVFGNLVAFATIGDRAPDTLDDCGAVYMRTNNNNGFYDPPTNSLASSNEISTFTQNAFLQVEDGPVFAMQKNTNASAAPWPTLVSDRNLYVSVSEFGQKTAANTTTKTVEFIDTWSAAQFGDWQADTGRDALSIVRSRDESETRTDQPTVSELEILRLYDEYDTYDPPTLSMVGAFPFSGGT